MERVINIIPYFINRLKGCATNNEITNWAYLSIENVLGLNRSDCILQSELKLSKEVANRFVSIVDELIKSRPIQHIIGEVKFCGFNLKVDHNALIPRPETEELVDWVLQDEFNSVLDIGTGTGCIAIAIALNTKATVTAIDISREALRLAKYNALQNHVDINFLQQDILLINKIPSVDVIISNPPYVLDSEKQFMNKNVLNYDPHISLFVTNEDPLLFYDKISDLAMPNLSVDGKLYFEINEKFGSDICLMLDKKGFVDIELKKDVNNKERMIKSVKK